MHGPRFTLAASTISLCLIWTSGCAEMAERTSDGLAKLAWWKKTPEQLMNIKTPDDRIKELHQMAKAAKKKSADEQQKDVADLTKEFQNENDGLVRRQILRTMAEYPTPAAGALIVSALNDADTETRRTACTCLGRRGGKDAVQELARVNSSDTDLDVRIAAVMALGKTKDNSAVPVLAEVLVDPDVAIQARAIESLTSVSGRDYGNNAQAWREYAQTGKTDAKEVSLAERVRRTVNEVVR